jgi:hypothetical protein
VRAPDQILASFLTQNPSLGLERVDSWRMDAEPDLPQPIDVAHLRAPGRRELVLTLGFSAAPPAGSADNRSEYGAWAPLEAPYLDELRRLVYAVARSAFRATQAGGVFNWDTFPPGDGRFGFVAVPLGSFTDADRVTMLRMPFPIAAADYPGYQRLATEEERSAWFHARADSLDALDAAWQALGFSPRRGARPASAPPSAISFRFRTGSAFGPASVHGAVSVELSRGGEVVVGHQRGPVRDTWTARVHASVVDDIDAALAAGLPRQEVSPVVPDTALIQIGRTIGGTAEEASVRPEVVQRTPPLARAVACFESIARQVAGEALGFLTDALTPVLLGAPVFSSEHGWLPVRRFLIAEWNQNHQALQRDSRGDERAGLLARQTKIAREYLSGLPANRVSRCPFTGALVHHIMDPWGLDGLWWDSSGLCRPTVPGAPENLLGFTGCLRLAEPVEDTLHLVLPGPLTLTHISWSS